MLEGERVDLKCAGQEDYEAIDHCLVSPHLASHIYSGLVNLCVI